MFCYVPSSVPEKAFEFVCDCIKGHQQIYSFWFFLFAVMLVYLAFWIHTQQSVMQRSFMMQQGSEELRIPLTASRHCNSFLRPEHTCTCIYHNPPVSSLLHEYTQLKEVSGVLQYTLHQLPVSIERIAEAASHTAPQHFTYTASEYLHTQPNTWNSTYRPILPCDRHCTYPTWF